MNAKETIKEAMEDACHSIIAVCDRLLDHEERVKKLEVAVEKELEFLGMLTRNVLDSRRRTELEKHLANLHETFKANQTEEAEP